jgi:hypothetical protein
MPELPGYKHAKGYNIPKTTKGKAVEHCLAECYPAVRLKFPGEDPEQKRIAASICHKRCG